MSSAKETGLRAAIVDFEDFIDRPPSYENQRMVRDYRHELYPKWSKVRDLALASLSPAEAEALPDGVEAGRYISVGWQHRLQVKSTEQWPELRDFCEWRDGRHGLSEKMAAGFNIEEREIFALSPAPAQAGSAGDMGSHPRGSGPGPSSEERE